MQKSGCASWVNGLPWATCCQACIEMVTVDWHGTANDFVRTAIAENDLFLPCITKTRGVAHELAAIDRFRLPEHAHDPAVVTIPLRHLADDYAPARTIRLYRICAAAHALEQRWVADEQERLAAHSREIDVLADLLEGAVGAAPDYCARGRHMQRVRWQQRWLPAWTRAPVWHDEALLTDWPLPAHEPHYAVCTAHALHRLLRRRGACEFGREALFEELFGPLGEERTRTCPPHVHAQLAEVSRRLTEDGAALLLLHARLLPCSEVFARYLPYLFAVQGNRKQVYERVARGARASAPAARRPYVLIDAFYLLLGTISSGAEVDPAQPVQLERLWPLYEYWSERRNTARNAFDYMQAHASTHVAMHLIVRMLGFARRILHILRTIDRAKLPDLVD